VPIKQAFSRQAANLEAAVPLLASVITALLLLFVVHNASSQVLNQHSEPTAQEMPKATVTQEIKGTVKSPLKPKNAAVSWRRALLVLCRWGVTRI
jgi:ABC-type enterochelin transport system substrate-binding protein